MLILLPSFLPPFYDRHRPKRPVHCSNDNDNDNDNARDQLIVILLKQSLVVSR